MLVDELGIEPRPALQQLARVDPSAGVGAPAGSRAAVSARTSSARSSRSARRRLVPVLGPGPPSRKRRTRSQPAGRRLRLPGGAPRGSHARVAVRRGDPRRRAALRRAARAVRVGAGSRALSSALLAGVPRDRTRARASTTSSMVTTGYDRALERAFEDAGEEVDVVLVRRRGADRGKFVHRRPGRHGDRRRRAEHRTATSRSPSAP